MPGTGARRESGGLPPAMTAAARPEEVRLHGAASVADRLVNPYRAAVEKATGHILTVVVSNAGKGLIDLVEGRCDAAMSSASLETTAQAARVAGTEVDIAGLEMQVAATDEIVFVVHPANPVRRLSWEQLRDMHTGKITRWKEVGGTDLPIVIFTDAAASATRGLIRDRVLGGQEYGPTANALETVRQVGELVATTEGGIGGLGLGFVDPARVRVVESSRLERPLGFITVGPPSEKVRRVIEAYRVQARP